MRKQFLSGGDLNGHVKMIMGDLKEFMKAMGKE